MKTALLFFMIGYYQNKQATLICLSQKVSQKFWYLLYISKQFSTAKKQFRNHFNLIFFEQTLRDIMLLFHDIAGLYMFLQEWKQLCRKAWEKVCDYLQIDRLGKTGDGRYTIRIGKKNYF